MITITRYTFAKTEEGAVNSLTSNGISSWIIGYETEKQAKDALVFFLQSSQNDSQYWSDLSVYKVTVNVGIISSKAEKVE